MEVCDVGILVNGLEGLFWVIGKVELMGEGVCGVGEFCFKLGVVGVCVLEDGVEVVVSDRGWNDMLIKGD